MTGQEGVAIAILAAIGVTGTFFDVRYRRLPHWLCAIAVLVGPGLALAMDGGAVAGSGLLHAAIALTGGFLLFAAGMIGGGDAKYYAALAAWFPLRDGLHLLVSVTLSGACLLAAWLVYRRLRGPRMIRELASDPFDKLPYGVAISAGALLSLTMLSLRG